MYCLFLIFDNVRMMTTKEGWPQILVAIVSPWTVANIFRLFDKWTIHQRLLAYVKSNAIP